MGEKAEERGGRKNGGEKARRKVGRVESIPSATNYGKGGDHKSDPFYFRSTAENLPSVTRYGLLKGPQYVSAFLAQLRPAVTPITKIWCSLGLRISTIVRDLPINNDCLLQFMTL